MTPTLTICIATLQRRMGMFASLLRELERQRKPFGDQVEILVRLDNGQETTGAKRNWLYQNAKGEYVCSVDDDDTVAPYYIHEIMHALQSKPDAVGMNGVITTDGRHEKKWFIAKDNPYESVTINGKEVYLRWHNHLSPVLRSIAIQFPFPDVTIGEDSGYAEAMHKSGLIKTEVVIGTTVEEYRNFRHKDPVKPLYFYRFLSHKR